MYILIILTVSCLLISSIISREKTLAGIKKGVLMFLNILPTLFTILILVSAMLFLTPEEVLVKWLGKEAGVAGVLLAAVVGSVSLIPGFIAFPLGAILLQSGVSYAVIAVFITTLMMVGVITLPLEAKYFGWRAAVTRNAFSFIGALVIGLTMALLWTLL